MTAETAARAEPLLLMTPGPTRVPERVLRAGSRPMIHHRTPEFSRELATAMELLQPVFGTRQPVLPVHTTGRGALEAVICNLFSRGDEIAVCCNGKFGEMWASLAESYGVVVHRWSTEWSRSANPAELDALLRERPAVRAALVAYVDTATGVANDLQAVARVANARGVMTLVDGVASIGGMPFSFDEWQVDVAVVASQKCLMSSPGLSWVVMSERAWQAYDRSSLPRNYWDLGEVKRVTGKTPPETPGTPPVEVVLQNAEALRQMHEEGLENVYKRHAQIAEYVRAQAQTLGLSLQCPSLDRFASTMTAIALPEGVAPKPLRDRIKVAGILTAAGLGHYVTTGFRIGHMGDIRMADAERTMSALSDALAATGSRFATAS